jgi:hypothetical protein
MEDNNLLQRFYNQIETELEFCDGHITPIVCHNYSNIAYKNDLVQTIADIVITQKISIADAIVQVERLYSVNNID